MQLAGYQGSIPKELEIESSKHSTPNSKLYQKLSSASGESFSSFFADVTAYHKRTGDLPKEPPKVASHKDRGVTNEENHVRETFDASIRSDHVRPLYDSLPQDRMSVERSSWLALGPSRWMAQSSLAPYRESDA